MDFDKLQNKEIEPPYKPSAELLTLKDNELLEDDPDLKDIKDEDT